MSIASHTDKRRSEIVRACRELYQTMSFKDITIKEISEYTSFSRPSIYNYFATKPLKFGLLKAQKKLKEKPENLAVVGDQLFTDVLGANRCKMFSILVDPIAERDILITKVKRPIENFLKKKYFEKLNKGGVMDKK